MTWVEGDYWLLTLDLPAGEHEFKVVVAPAEGGSPPLWEHGPNRRVAVPEAEAAARGAFTVVWQWGDPKVRPLLPARLPAALAAGPNSGRLKHIVGPATDIALHASGRQWRPHPHPTHPRSSLLPESCL